jgi:hypothetical protein
MAGVFLTEFVKLKDEQISRASLRDNLFNITIVLIGGGITIAFSRPPQSLGLLLLLPIVGFVAGMSHVASDRRISKIGSYFREKLASKVAAEESLPADQVFEWETYIRNDRARVSRKILQFVTNMLLYFGSGAFAVTWYVFFVKDPASLTLVERFACGGDTFLLALVFWQIAAHADFGPARSLAARAVRFVGRVVVAAMAAGVCGLAVLKFGREFVVGADQTWTSGVPYVHLTRLSVLAATAALIAWSIVLLMRRPTRTRDSR